MSCVPACAKEAWHTQGQQSPLAPVLAGLVLQLWTALAQALLSGMAAGLVLLWPTSSMPTSRALMAEQCRSIHGHAVMASSRLEKSSGSHKSCCLRCTAQIRMCMVEHDHAVCLKAAHRRIRSTGQLALMQTGLQVERQDESVGLGEVALAETLAVVRDPPQPGAGGG